MTTRPNPQSTLNQGLIWCPTHRHQALAVNFPRASCWTPPATFRTPQKQKPFRGLQGTTARKLPVLVHPRTSEQHQNATSFTPRADLQLLIYNPHFFK